MAYAPNSSKAGYGEFSLLVTVLASVLGGTSASGGFGRVSGLIMALIVLQIVSSGLNLLRVSERSPVKGGHAVILADSTKHAIKKCTTRNGKRRIATHLR